MPLPLRDFSRPSRSRPESMHGNDDVSVNVQVLIRSSCGISSMFGALPSAHSTRQRLTHG